MNPKLFASSKVGVSFQNPLSVFLVGLPGVHFQISRKLSEVFTPNTSLSLDDVRCQFSLQSEEVVDDAILKFSQCFGELERKKFNLAVEFPLPATFDLSLFVGFLPKNRYVILLSPFGAPSPVVEDLESRLLGALPPFAMSRYSYRVLNSEQAIQFSPVYPAAPQFDLSGKLPIL